MLLASIFYNASGQLFSKEQGVLEIFYKVFFIVILVQPLNSIAFTLDAIFKGLGEMAYLRNALLIATFLGFVPVIYLARELNWGLQGIWIAFVVWLFLRAFILALKYKTKYYALAKD